MWKDWVKIPHWSATVKVGIPCQLFVDYETRREIMKKVLKRDGAIIDFNSSKITDAITKASTVTKEFDP